MEMTTLKAEPRKAAGTRVAQALRAQGLLPIVIYGHGEAPETASLSGHDFEVALAHGARTLHVELGGQTKQYLIKAVQYDYLGDTPIHIDLTRVALDERVKVRVGIELRGVPKGVSEGGVLDQSMADMEVECLVTEIPDTLRPLISELGLGESLLVKDLALPPGVVAISDGEDRVATVRALAEEVEAEPTEEEPGEKKEGEPERIGRVKKEEGEESS